MPGVNPMSGRYTVELDDGSKVKVKSSNVLPEDMDMVFPKGMTPWGSGGADTNRHLNQNPNIEKVVMENAARRAAEGTSEEEMMMQMKEQLKDQMEK